MDGTRLLTDPVELGPELLELVGERDGRFGHAPIVARGAAREPPGPC